MIHSGSQNGNRFLFFLTLRQSITDANSTNINNQNEKTNEEKKFTTLLDKHST